MGHDIYARRVSEQERDKLYEAFNASVGDATGQDWLDKFGEYEKAANVAYLRRSAGNPLNTVLYQALNAMNFYAGCSGCGAGRSFTRAEIEAALESLPGIPAERPRNFADDLLGMLRASGAEVVSGVGPLEKNVTPAELAPEYKFLRDTLAWMDEQKLDSVEIEFR